MFSANVIDSNLIGIIVESNSAFQTSGNTIKNNTDHGLLIFKDGFINLFDPKNTIEDNGTDVTCIERGGLEVSSTQTSGTGTTNISADCLVVGTIF